MDISKCHFQTLQNGNKIGELTSMAIRNRSRLCNAAFQETSQVRKPSEN